MLKFWLRFTVFSTFWILWITVYSNESAFSILMFTASIGIYFFLTFKKNLVLYISLIASILMHGLFFESKENFYPIFLILYLLIIGLYQLEKVKFIIFSFISGCVLVYLCLLMDIYAFELILLMSFFYFLAIQSKEIVHLNLNQKLLYDQLTTEYRHLKRMYSATEQNTKMVERTRIARELHDSVGHQLTALIIKLEMLAIQKEDDTYRELKKMALESLDETREAVKALQLKDDEGIAAVVQLIRQLETSSNLHIQFTMKHGILSINLSNQISAGIYRIIQEALTNAMRHSTKRFIQVELGKSAVGDIEFFIKNEMTELKRLEEGFGLSNMRKRAEELGGKIEIHQTESAFIVSGRLPVK